MKKVVFWFIFGAFTFWGCKGKPDDRQVMIVFSTQSLSSSVLKSSVNPDEDLISKVILFGVDAQGKVVDRFPVETSPPTTGITLSISDQVKSFYAVANLSNTSETANLSSATDLMNLTGDFANAPRTPLLMGGNANVNGSNIEIVMIRAVAKIEITGKNGFVIESVTVTNTPNRGYVFKQASRLVPPSAAMISYPKINGKDPSFYVAENAKSSSTQFVVTGTFEGKQASYTFPLSQNKVIIDIERNKFYQVEVSPESPTECNISITIPGWDEVNADEVIIPDEYFDEP